MKTVCTNCGQHYEVEEQYNGQYLTCPQCNKNFLCSALKEKQASESLILQTHPCLFSFDISFFSFIICAVVSAVAVYSYNAAGDLLGKEVIRTSCLSVGAFFAIMLLYFIFAVVSAKTTLYTLYNNKIEVICGIFAKDIRTINVQDTQDIIITQDLIQLLQGSGDLYCNNKGSQTPFVMQNIPNHKKWKEEIEKLIR